MNHGAFGLYMSPYHSLLILKTPFDMFVLLHVINNRVNIVKFMFRNAEFGRGGLSGGISQFIRVEN